MTVFPLIIGAALIAIGTVWGWLVGASAEKPALLLVFVGACFCINAVLGPIWVGYAIGACILFMAIMLVSQTRGGGERGRNER